MARLKRKNSGADKPLVYIEKNLDGIYNTVKDIIDENPTDNIGILFEKIMFDEKTYTGFDIYDMDISMQVLINGYSVRVINDVLIEHFNQSVFSENFYKNQELFFNKWHSYFPIYRGVELNDTFTIIVNNICHANYNYNKMLLERNRILRSNAYRLGKTILKPLKFFKNILE